MRKFYRDQQKFYYLPVIMSDMRGTGSREAKTGTSTMTIEIGDENNHEHGPGHKDIFVYKYDFKGELQGLVVVLVIACNYTVLSAVKGHYVNKC